MRWEDVKSGLNLVFDYAVKEILALPDDQDFSALESELTRLFEVHVADVLHKDVAVEGSEGYRLLSAGYRVEDSDPYELLRAGYLRSCMFLAVEDIQRRPVSEDYFAYIDYLKKGFDRFRDENPDLDSDVCRIGFVNTLETEQSSSKIITVLGFIRRYQKTETECRWFGGKKIPVVYEKNMQGFLNREAEAIESDPLFDFVVQDLERHKFLNRIYFENRELFE